MAIIQETMSETTVHVDDDRFKFCENQQSQLSLTYFWAAIESLGLTSFCLQNLGHM